MDDRKRAVKTLVEQFYSRIWNNGDFAAAEEILAGDFRFRGSLGSERRGRAEFIQYVREVTAALADYECIIEDIVCEGEKAFAKMLFRGLHRGEFMSFAATGKPVEWGGAALFRMADSKIAELWVLGDLAGLRDVLQRNA